jgi:tetratricopeptide (TPR) repeat protein
LYDRAGMRIRQGDWGGAIPDYDQALAIDPNYLVAYISRGNARYHERDPLAHSDFLHGFRLDPAAYAREVIRILMEDLARDPDAVLANCDNHIRSNPDDPVAWSRRGLSLLLLKREEEGIAALQRSAEIVPEYRSHYEPIMQAIAERTSVN